MTEASALTAFSRDVIGHANRKLGPEGRIPAVLYGMGRDSLAIAVDRHEFELFMSHHSAGSTLVSLALEGEKKPINAMIKDVQHSAVKSNVIHIDFQAVDMDETIHANVTLHLVNDPEGVKAGGVLTVALHDVLVEAKPGDLVEAIDVDVSALNIGDSLHVSDIVAPKGMVILGDMDAIVASVQAPRVETEETEETITEPEVIGAKSDEE